MAEEENEKEIDFNSSMTDLMTSLMIMFILLLVVLFNHIGEKGKQIRDVMAAELRDEILNNESTNSMKNLKIVADEKDPLSFIVNIDEASGLKFDSNDAKLQKQSKEKLDATYKTMVNYICKAENKKNIDSIQIIGYTDKNPVKADPKFGNLSLSQDRALTVLKEGLYLFGMNSNEGKCLRELASINGRGMEDLKNSDAESRRVEIKIRIKSAEQQNLVLSKNKSGLDNLLGGYNAK